MSSEGERERERDRERDREGEGGRGRERNTRQKLHLFNDLTTLEVTWHHVLLII
jgi:hypothetical protein